jgi:hypothetical protein
MTELDQVWSQLLGEAATKAVASGRRDVAEYLRLKAANDAVRSAGVEWLIETFCEIAGDAMRDNSFLKMERKTPHNFLDDQSNMVGTLLSLHYGVRCLTVEAGWTRSPRDGIMRNSALAFARMEHFGLPQFRTEIRLIPGDILPAWIDQDGEVIDTAVLKHHVDLLLDK